MKLNLSDIDIAYCIDHATVIAEQYMLQHIGADDPCRYLDYLLASCGLFLSKNVRMVELDIPADSTSVRAACINKPDGYDIAYVKGLDEDWKRFVVCKEAFHVVLDHPDMWNMDIEAHVNEVTLPLAEATPGRSAVAETMAEISAMEFLFPYKRRIVELAGPHKGDSAWIAQWYKIPQYHVERYLAPGMMEHLKAHSPG